MSKKIIKFLSASNELLHSGILVVPMCFFKANSESDLLYKHKRKRNAKKVDFYIPGTILAHTHTYTHNHYIICNFKVHFIYRIITFIHLPLIL